MIRSGPRFELLAVNDLGDGNHASPAVAGDVMPTRKGCWFRGNCLDQEEVDVAAAGAQHLAVATDLGLDLDRRCARYLLP